MSEPKDSLKMAEEFLQTWYLPPEANGALSLLIDAAREEAFLAGAVAVERRDIEWFKEYGWIYDYDGTRQLSEFETREQLYEAWEGK